MKHTRIILIHLFLLTSQVLFAQTDVIDKVIAVVGDEVILQSSVEMQYYQLISQGQSVDEDFKCSILKESLREKILIHQARIDSIEINEDEINDELDRRIRYFTQMFGSQEKLEDYYEKSIVQIKDEFREEIRNQLLSNKVKGGITSSVNVTPKEVANYFKHMPKDSIPYYNAQIEIGQIVIHPKVSPIQDSLALKKITDLRTRISKGEKFSTMALLYSQDPGSAQKGGELGFMPRGSLVPEFEEVAYQLAPGEVSEVVKSDFGYHIIEMIKRRGESINVSHILIKPTITGEDMRAAEKKLDSVRSLIIADNITFENAVKNFTEDEQTKGSGGMFLNQATASTSFDMDELDPNVYFNIEKLNAGDYSKVALFTTPRGEQAYRFLFLKSETEPHKASLQTDYESIKQLAIRERREEKIEEWFLARINKNYVFIHEDFLNCTVLEKWINHNKLESKEEN